MDNRLKDILSRVQKPARYIGCETNAVVKEHSPEKTSIVLAYPDTYEVGMSYLGLKILYHLINEREDALCERVFAPWQDMEKELLKNKMELFSLETKRPIKTFDIIGFSLCYELTYTNVLNMLHLGGITVVAEKRGEDEPIVIGGGACTSNPEPMSLFFDAFVIGDGEEVIQDIIEVYKKFKIQNPKPKIRIPGSREIQNPKSKIQNSGNRKIILRELSKIKGVYVPSLYKEEYKNGKFIGLIPKEEGVPKSIKRVFVKDLEKAYYPVRQIVPLIKIIQDRLVIEIMRGCPNKCRFCQAGVINRPVRLRSQGTIRHLLKEAYEKTGYEKISLLSLSSVNYPHLADLIRKLTKDFGNEGVGISIPSLKVDKALYKLPEVIAQVTKSGLTFAVESADESLRKAMAKDVDINILCRSAYEAFKYGWKRLKLYFIVGIRPKDDDETKKIMDLAKKLSFIKKEVAHSPAEIKVNVNVFVPKAHTPMQWLGMRNKQELEDIKKEFFSKKTKRITIEFSNINQSILEGCLARGERKIAGVIYEAWKRGARMDGWTDFFDFKIWHNAFQKKGLDMCLYAERRYDIDDKLPWEHIKANLMKDGWDKKEFSEAGFTE